MVWGLGFRAPKTKRLWQVAADMHKGKALPDLVAKAGFFRAEGVR